MLARHDRSLPMPIMPRAARPWYGLRFLLGLPLLPVELVEQLIEAGIVSLPGDGDAAVVLFEAFLFAEAAVCAVADEFAAVLFDFLAVPETQACPWLGLDALRR